MLEHEKSRLLVVKVDFLLTKYYNHLKTSEKYGLF